MRDLLKDKLSDEISVSSMPHNLKSATSSHTRLKELDGWRAISVLMVILNHISTYQYPGLVARFHPLQRSLWFFGFLGVDTFFLISGFVICRLLIKEELRFGSVSLRGFYLRRIFRILPPLYLYLAVVSVLLLAGRIEERWVSLPIAIAFLFDLRLFPYSWFCGHTWSLAVEEQFYLIFPAIWIFCRPRWRSSLIALTLLLCAIWNVTLALSQEQNPIFDTRARAGFASICCGVLIAIHEERFRRFIRRVSGWLVLLVGIAILIHPVPHGDLPEAVYTGFLMAPAIGLVLIYSLDCGGWLQRVLCSRPMQAVGLTSYGVYLWQQLFTGPVTFYSKVARATPIFLPLLLVVVPLSYLFVEKPAMRVGKRLSDRVRAKISGQPTGIV